MDPWHIVAILGTALGASWSAAAAAFFKGDLIPGYVYRREVKRADDAIAETTKNALALAALAKTIRKSKADGPLG